MRPLIDEILEMESAPPTHPCGCNCSGCRSNQTVHPLGCTCAHCRGANLQEVPQLDELLYELGGNALQSAVSYNRKKSVSLGWRKFYDAIVSKVLRLNYSPNEQAFAKAVAKWQAAKRLTADGKVGANTWNAMKPILGQSASTQGGSVTGPTAFVGDDLKPCPVLNPGTAKDKCLHPGTKACPKIPNLLCMRGVNNIPFEYVHNKDKDYMFALDRVTRGEMHRKQYFVQPVRDALIQFTQNMAKYGMPVKSILTLGSLYCRCVSNSDNLSNHSYGEAIDVAGIRWKPPHPLSRVEDTLVTPRNLTDSEQGRLFQRINACLRLSFPNVIDYHRSDHRDHFHCDLNRGGRSLPTATIKFVQEALNLALKKDLSINGTLDSKTYQALSEFSGLDITALKNTTTRNQVFRRLFEKIATGKF